MLWRKYWIAVQLSSPLAVEGKTMRWSPRREWWMAQLCLTKWCRGSFLCPQTAMSNFNDDCWVYYWGGNDMSAYCPGCFSITAQIWWLPLEPSIKIGGAINDEWEFTSLWQMDLDYLSFALFSSVWQGKMRECVCFSLLLLAKGVGWIDCFEAQSLSHG